MGQPTKRQRGDEAKGDHRVKPPQAKMNRIHVSFPDPGSDKYFRAAEAHEGNAGHGSIFTDDAQALNEVTGDTQHQQRCEHQPVGRTMFHRAIPAHAPPGKPHCAANHQQAESVQRDFVDYIIYAFMKQRLGGLAPHQRRAVMLDADEDGADEQREESPE